MSTCTATQSHWGFPCARDEHPPDSPHWAVTGQEIIALWWEPERAAQEDIMETPAAMTGEEPQGD